MRSGPFVYGGFGPYFFKRSRTKAEKKESRLKEYAELAVVALLIALVVRTLLVQAYKIPSGSMLPTLEIGDQILVNKFIYGVKVPYLMKTIIPVSEPKRGDLVVFVFPLDRSKDFVKRVIGVGGDTVEMKNKQLFINGERYADPHGRYADPLILPGAMQPRDNFGPVRVPQGSYFMMGDNRDYSEDSRFWGTVEGKDVIGKAFMIFFSWDTQRHGIRWDRIGRILD